MPRRQATGHASLDLPRSPPTSARICPPPFSLAGQATWAAWRHLKKLLKSEAEALKKAPEQNHHAAARIQAQSRGKQARHLPCSRHSLSRHL